MKNILIALGLLIGTLAWSEPAFTDVIAQTTNNPTYPPAASKSSTAETAVDDVISILLDQGFAGAIIVILFLWTYRTDKANRASQKENFDKFVEISAECSGHMAAVSARLENIEREIEQAKQIEMLTASRVK
tara:strand:+ start:502 stop:897 length:396 start_codon:yes stop_codon:yes gene_type:complete